MELRDFGFNYRTGGGKPVIGRALAITCSDTQLFIGETVMTNILKLQTLKPELTTNFHNGLMSTLSSICPMASGEDNRKSFERE